MFTKLTESNGVDQNKKQDFGVEGVDNVFRKSICLVTRDCTVFYLAFSSLPFCVQRDSRWSQTTTHDTSRSNKNKGREDVTCVFATISRETHQNIHQNNMKKVCRVNSFHRKKKCHIKQCHFSDRRWSRDIFLPRNQINFGIFNNKTALAERNQRR